MKFNTLTFDANLPTVQQVNVPTNTDYKVGMKVKRNGEVQSIKPSEFTIYTGDVNVIPPEQYTAATKECENAGAMQFLNLKDTDLSAVAGKRIKSTDIWVEFSFDNGTTWTKGIGGTDTIPVKVNDRSAGSNNYIASVNLSNPSKWTLLDHNVPTGEYADYVTVPEVPYIMIQFLGSLFTNITSYPCLWRLVFLYGGQEIPVTIPTDADKTNGYVTFTQASNDDANFKQLSVAVSVPAVPETVVKEAKNIVNTTGSRLTKQGVEISMEDHSELLGKAITPLNIIYNTADGTGTTPPDLSALEAEAVNVWSDANPVYSMAAVAILLNGDQLTVGDYNLIPPPSSQRQQFIDLGAPADKPFFVRYKLGSSGWSLDGFEAEHILVEGDIIYPVRNNIKNNTSRGFVLKLMMGDAVPAWSANFKLNVNEFKSQCGDLNVQTDPEFNTAKVEGTYADGTEFSFDFCKE